MAPTFAGLRTAFGRRGSALVRSRAFRWASGTATLGCVAWEVVEHFAAMHEEHGMAELCFGLPQEVRKARREKEARFRALLEQARQRQAAGGVPADTLEAHRLLYPGLSPEELRTRRQEHGAVKWTEKALQVAVAMSPLLEVGAGRGQWQKALTERGANVLAYDDMSSPTVRLGLIGQVNRGNEEVVRRHADRALLLVYPNPGPMARKCLENYAGERLPPTVSRRVMSTVPGEGSDALVYVGEGRGGVNGDDAFFDLLSAEWRL
eukprot:CAMPEP_0175383282 /NCGR_PEP_ID=MMETSP0095-20121207/27754_1 /TAXON_ID=311494 /ORGANISM="Alexandrium monilatum, Strain CCMP3105" /LENGTH=263 /DNA_ID=CAMNT_0016681679 /DNA_START=79 /DNA_END=868 /DNA_ORIENTATION=+